MTPRRRGLIVCGTDTGVGKTVVSSALLRLAASRPPGAVPYKPVETGVLSEPADARRLLTASARTDLTLAEVCPFPFAPPVAPAVAAQLAGMELSLSTIVRRIPDRPGALLLECAGGLLTPITPTETALDLAVLLQLPVLLVARNSLGTINHSALALAELRRRNLAVAAVVLVDTTGAIAPDAPHNARSIERLTGTRPLGPLPFLTDNSPDAAAQAFATLDGAAAVLAQLR